MARRIGSILSEISARLGALPGVFSTPQWGGRAYKVPAAGGTKRKPKLLAFVGTDPSGDAVLVSFKLPPSRARAVVRAHDWIRPHAFRTLAPAGWVSAQVTGVRQVRSLTPLLEESRSLLPEVTDEAVAERSSAASRSDATARRLDRLMGEIIAGGWAPREDGDFDR